MLSGRGYAIAPAPVRLSGRTVLGLVLAVTVAATIPALWLSSRCFVGPAEPLPELSAQQQAAAQNLTALGDGRELVQALSPEELDRCAGAVSVQRAVAFQNGEDTPERQQLEDGTAGELSAYLVELSDGQLRWYYWFDLKEMPGRRIQEVFTVDPSGNYQATDYAARLLWDVDGETETGLAPGEAVRGQDRRGTVRVGALLCQPGAGALWLQPLFPLVPLLRAQGRPAGSGDTWPTPPRCPRGRNTRRLRLCLPPPPDPLAALPLPEHPDPGRYAGRAEQGHRRTLWTGVQYYP